MPGPDAALVELQGRLIRLRALGAEEAESAWQGLALQDEAAHPRLRREDRLPQPSEEFRRRIGRSGKLWRGCLDLGIDREGRLIGQIQARSSPKQTLPAGVFEIGVVLYQPHDRGHRYGREAVELLTTWLFQTGGAHRVQATTDAGNTSMRSALEHLGFRLEGILRAFGVLGDGTRVDGALYAAVRSDWMKRPDASPSI